MHWLTGALFGMAALAAASAGAPAHAAANLVVNGDFEQFTNPSATPTTSYQVTSPNTATGGTLTGWTNAGYTFVFNAGKADTTGSYSSEYSNNLVFYGPGNGVANGLTASSPTGGNFLASDGAYESGAISQTISGLTVGYAYQLTFQWGGAQQTGYTGNTTEGWGVTFGNQTYSVTNAPTGQASQGFTPWRQATFTFVPTSTTQTLSFLASGAPSGTPPFSLLDGVVLVATPEPATWAVMTIGLLATGLAFRARRRPAAAQA